MGLKMKFNIHNKLEILLGEQNYTFFNTMLSSVFEKYSNFGSFNNFILIGDGEPSKKQEAFKLTNQIYTTKLNLEIIQNDISKGQLYIRKNFIIDSNILIGNHITEIGITDSINSTTIYNYFSLINQDFPNGIYKSNEKLYGTITIYLELNFNNENFSILGGSNNFINYLLGEGLKSNISAVAGDYYKTDKTNLIFYPEYNIEYPLKININNNNPLEISFEIDTNKTTLNSLFLLLNKTPFALLKLQNYYILSENNSVFAPKQHYIIDIGKNIETVESIINTTTNQPEIDFCVRNYCNEFGHKVDISFNNLINKNTPRFTSNDGKYIAFVIDNNIYLYKNYNYELSQINTHGLYVQQIKNIHIIDNLLFIFSSIEPYIFVYFVNENELTKCEIDFNNFQDLALLNTATKIAIAKSKTNQILIGLINNENQNGETLYLKIENHQLIFESNIISEYNFSYVLAINSNNFCDAQIIYLQEGEYSHTSKIVYHYPDKTQKDVYSSLAYTLCNDAKEIYVKDRAIIVEKTTTPKIQIYHFPQVYQYLFPEIENECDYHISNNLLYMAIKSTNGSLRFYNMVGYNEIFEFVNEIPEDIKNKNINDVVFLNDMFLIFFDDENNTVAAYTLKQNRILIENLSSNTDNYLVKYKSYKLLGENNEGAIIKILMNISI